MEYCICDRMNKKIFSIEGNCRIQEEGGDFRMSVVIGSKEDSGMLLGRAGYGNVQKGQSALGL